MSALSVVAAQLWRWLRTVRARITVMASLVVAAALLVGAAGLLFALHRSLLQSVDDTARSRARDLAVLVLHDALPSTLTVPEEDDVAQVVDASGSVLAASRNAESAPIATFIPPGSEPFAQNVRGIGEVDDDEDFRIWGLRASSPEGPRVVYIGTSLEATQETLAAVRGALAVGLPLLLILLGLGTWIVVGRALRPVEAIRAEVADISGSALDRRVPVPPTDDEIGRLALTMNEMLDRLQESSRRQRSFIADASHELQSPLASFRTELEVALAHPGTGDWRATATDLLQDSERMERLVRDLLFLARTDDVPRAVPTAPVDLDDIVLDEAARLRASAAVTVDTSHVSAAPVHSSREELTRLTRNLLENAVRHASTAVRVDLAAAADGVRLVIEDDGPGVPPDQRKQIFERFARLDAARARESGGNGLGLAIVKEIAERHGGEVSVEDSPVGARFVVNLPKRRRSPEELTSVPLG